MKTIEERAWEKYPEEIRHTDLADIDANFGLRHRYIETATEQKAIDEDHFRDAKKKVIDKRTNELLQYLEELEAHYRDLGQYDGGKPIRRVIEYVKAMED